MPREGGCRGLAQRLQEGEELALRRGRRASAPRSRRGRPTPLTRRISEKSRRTIARIARPNDPASTTATARRRAGGVRKAPGVTAAQAIEIGERRRAQGGGGSAHRAASRPRRAWRRRSVAWSIATTVRTIMSRMALSRHCRSCGSPPAATGRCRRHDEAHDAGAAHVDLEAQQPVGGEVSTAPAAPPRSATVSTQDAPVARSHLDRLHVDVLDHLGKELAERPGAVDGERQHPDHRTQAERDDEDQREHHLGHRAAQFGGSGGDEQPHCARARGWRPATSRGRTPRCRRSSVPR